MSDLHTFHFLVTSLRGDPFERTYEARDEEHAWEQFGAYLAKVGIDEVEWESNSYEAHVTRR